MESRSGFFANVYAGHYQFEGRARPVAYKLFRGDKHLSAPGTHDRLARELDAMTQLKHENLMEVYGLVHFDRTIGVVMELLDDGCLATLLGDRSKGNQISWQQRVTFACNIAAGMRALHQVRPNPIVHQNLRCQNILVCVGELRTNKYKYKYKYNYKYKLYKIKIKHTL